MASETFFENGEKVMLSAFYLNYHADIKDEASNLVGTIVSCDDTGRECCYYDVKWENISEKLLAKIGNNSYQSDFLVKYKKRKVDKKSLKAVFSKKENDILFKYEDSPTSGHLLHNFFNVYQVDGKTFVEHLKERGYDIKTIKFSIEKL